MKAVWSWIGERWCRWTHPEPMWPVKGHYYCPRCLRVYPVTWENGDNAMGLAPKTRSFGQAPADARAQAAGATAIAVPVLSR
jgi:hypothetical protein